jgi:hypothetical protein
MTLRRHVLVLRAVLAGDFLNNDVFLKFIDLRIIGSIDLGWHFFSVFPQLRNVFGSLTPGIAN